jgi:tRNA(Ile2) C34 agmatinyltransferase TiaS
MEKRVCKYCGKTAKGNGFTCEVCAKKLPLVRELVAIGRKIKAGAKK